MRNQDATESSTIKETTKHESLSNKSLTDTLSTPELTPGASSKDCLPAFTFDNLSTITKPQKSSLAKFAVKKSEGRPVSGQANGCEQASFLEKSNRPLKSRAIGTPFISHSFDATAWPRYLADTEVIQGFYANLQARNRAADPHYPLEALRFNAGPRMQSLY
jgi:hypothetical protein